MVSIIILSCPLLAVWHWASYLASLSFAFLTCDLGIHSPSSKSLLFCLAQNENEGSVRWQKDHKCWSQKVQVLSWKHWFFYTRLKKELTTHSSMLARESPWTAELGRLYSPWGRKSWIRLSNWTATTTSVRHEFLFSPPPSTCIETKQTSACDAPWPSRPLTSAPIFPFLALWSFSVTLNWKIAAKL